MINLRLSLTPLKNESRLFKQARAIVGSGIASRVDAIGLAADGLPEMESLDQNITLYRLALRSRGLPANFLFQILKSLEFLIRVAGTYRGRGVSMVNVHGVDLLPLGVILKWMFGARLVYDPHELETETNGISPLRRRMAVLFERTCIRFADHMFVVGDAIADHYRDKYNIARPTVVMNCPPARSSERTNKLRAGLGISGSTLIFLYQGGLVPGRGHVPFLDEPEAAEALLAWVEQMK